MRATVGSASSLRDLREQPLEIADIVVDRLAEIGVALVFAAQLVKGLLALQRVEAAGEDVALAALVAVPELHRRLVVDRAGDVDGKRVQQFHDLGRRALAGAGGSGARLGARRRRAPRPRCEEARRSRSATQPRASPLPPRARLERLRRRAAAAASPRPLPARRSPAGRRARAARRRLRPRAAPPDGGGLGRSSSARAGCRGMAPGRARGLGERRWRATAGCGAGGVDSPA